MTDNDLAPIVALHGAMLDVHQRALARLLAQMRHHDPRIVSDVLAQMQSDLERHKRRLAGLGFRLDPETLSRFDVPIRPERSRSSRDPNPDPHRAPAPHERREDRGSSA